MTLPTQNTGGRITGGNGSAIAEGMKGAIGMVSYYFSFSLGWVGRTPYPTPPLVRLGVTPSSCAAVGSHRIGKGKQAVGPNHRKGWPWLSEGCPSFNK